MRRTSMFPAMTAVPEARAPPSPTARATVEESLIRLTPHVSSRSALVGLLRDHGESAAIVAAALHAVSDSKAAAEPGEEELINAAVLAQARGQPLFDGARGKEEQEGIELTTTFVV